VSIYVRCFSKDAGGLSGGRAAKEKVRRLSDLAELFQLCVETQKASDLQSYRRDANEESPKRY